jgi:aromatic amino acid transport protein AroP
VASLTAAGDPYSASPFVRIFSLIGSDTAAHLLNLVVLTAALSVYNSGVYCNSRMLYGLAEQGDAPHALMRINRYGVPVLAVGVSALITFFCVAVNYLLPQSALELLMSLVVAALVINWTMISLTHLKFRRALRQRHVTPAFKAFWSPLANYLCLAFVAFLLFLMLDHPGTRASVIALPIWVALMWLCYRLQLRLQGRAIPS